LTSPASPARTALRQEWRWLLQLAALCAFAFTQPVLDVFGRSPETFVFRGAGPLTLAAFAIVLAVVPPVALFAVAVPARLAGATVRAWAHGGTVWVLVSLVAFQVLKRTASLPGAVAAGTAVAVGAGVTVAIVRARTLRRWLEFAALAQVAFVLLFLVASPASKLLRAPSTEAATATGVSRTPVVFVLFDELPLLTLLDARGEIDARSFPRFAELRRTSTWYRDYTVTDPATTFSIPTILSGKVATDRSKAPLAVDHPDNLFTMLGDSHRMEVFEFVTQLCPRELCRGVAGDGTGPGAGGGLPGLLGDAVTVWRQLSLPGRISGDLEGQFDDAAPQSDAGEGEPHVEGGRRLRALEPFLRSFEGRGERPGLHFLHVMLPHSPWRHLPSGQTYDKLRANDDRPTISGGGGPTRWVPGRWPAAFGHQRHILQARFVDRVLGSILDRLEESGLFDDALVVVTADHGIAFQPGGSLRTFEAGNLHEVMWVPLFIKEPGQRAPAVDDENLMAPDLLPTIADRLGVRVPFPVDGLPAGDPRIARRSGKLIAGFHLFGPGRPGRVRQTRHTIPEADVAEARRILRTSWFRPAVPSDDVEAWPYLIGPGAAWIGRPVEEMALGPSAGRRARLTLPRAGALEDVDPSGGRLPVLVWGTLGGPPAQARVAVALNGRMAGVSETFSFDGAEGRFAVLMPPWLLREGENDLALFLVEGSRLRPLQASPSPD